MDSAVKPVAFCGSMVTPLSRRTRRACRWWPERGSRSARRPSAPRRRWRSGWGGAGGAVRWLRRAADRRRRRDGAVGLGHDRDRLCHGGRCRLDRGDRLGGRAGARESDDGGRACRHSTYGHPPVTGISSLQLSFSTWFGLGRPLRQGPTLSAAAGPRGAGTHLGPTLTAVQRNRYQPVAGRLPAPRRSRVVGAASGPYTLLGVTESSTAAAAGPDGSDTDVPRYRYTADLAGRIEQTWQRNWQEWGRSTCPTRWARWRPPTAPACPTTRSSSRTCSPTPRVRVARRAPAGLHRHRRLRPLLPDDRAQCSARVGLRRVRPARRAVRDPDRHPSAHPHRSQHRELPQAARPPGTRPRQPPQLLHHRPRVLQVDAVDLPADLQRLVRSRTESGPADRRADRRIRLRHKKARRPELGGAVGGRAGRRDRRPPAGLSRRFGGELVSGAGHGVGQRGGHLGGRSERGNFPCSGNACGSG